MKGDRRLKRAIGYIVCTSIAILLFSTCAKEDFDGQLVKAAMQGNTDEIIRCLGEGADINAKDEKFNATALMWAAHNGRAEALRILIKNGADIHQKGARGETALWFAAQKGQLKTLKILVDHGANINIVGRDGDSALAIARENGHSHVVDYLKSSGASD